MLIISGRNSWCLGFPLVRMTADVTPTSTLSNITPLVWNTDITETTAVPVLTDRKTTLTDIINDFS